ncbi:hypothetical protein KJ632_01515, partial [Patescibacteria group bacterium]|nr:hypothetical protein [Patescibacteria group bacterium]
MNSVWIKVVLSVVVAVFMLVGCKFGGDDQVRLEAYLPADLPFVMVGEVGAGETESLRDFFNYAIDHELVDGDFADFGMFFEQEYRVAFGLWEDFSGVFVFDVERAPGVKEWILEQEGYEELGEDLYRIGELRDGGDFLESRSEEMALIEEFDGDLNFYADVYTFAGEFGLPGPVLVESSRYQSFFGALDFDADGVGLSTKGFFVEGYEKGMGDRKDSLVNKAIGEDLALYFQADSLGNFLDKDIEIEVENPEVPRKIFDEALPGDEVEDAEPEVLDYYLEDRVSADLDVKKSNVRELVLKFLMEVSGLEVSGLEEILDNPFSVGLYDVYEGVPGMAFYFQVGDVAKFEPVLESLENYVDETRGYFNKNMNDLFGVDALLRKDIEIIKGKAVSSLYFDFSQ